MGFTLRSGRPFSPGWSVFHVAARGMASRRLPASHYFFSVSRGDAIRTFMVGRLRCGRSRRSRSSRSPGPPPRPPIRLSRRSDGAVVARQAQMVTAYEDRLAEARARLDEVASRQLLDKTPSRAKCTNSCRGRPGSSGAARSSPRSPPRLRRAIPPLPPAQAAAVASPSSALGAIQALSPQPPSAERESAARAYAPSSGLSVERGPPKPHPIDETARDREPVTLGADRCAGECRA